MKTAMVVTISPLSAETRAGLVPVMTCQVWRAAVQAKARKRTATTRELTAATVKRPPRLSSDHAASSMPAATRSGKAVIHRARKAAHSQISQRRGGGASSMGRA